MTSLKSTDIHLFLDLAKQLPLLDVRSEGEYNQGHIPGAVSFPILTNEERAMVGTCYKKNGHNAAVLLGYELTGTKFSSYIQQAFELFPEKKLLIHCFRGGLRSRIMAWLLHSAGFEVTLLKGGYKKYREYILNQLNKPYPFLVVGGYTGSEKTTLLHLLKDAGEYVIDIEALAVHRGSAYGSIGLPPQPTNEQFENNLAKALMDAGSGKYIWIEDESRKTGTVVLPEQIYESKMRAPLFFIDKNKEERIKSILELYGSFEKEQLIRSTQKLEKKLGNQRMRMAVEAISENRYAIWLDIVLDYYDRTYLFGIEKRSKDQIIKLQAPSNEAYIKELLQFKSKMLQQS